MASETAELIIQFNRGVDESTARQVVNELGGSVRRKMRTDHEDQVMLLTRVPADEVRQKAQQAAGHPQVEMVEVNSGGFSIR